MAAIHAVAITLPGIARKGVEEKLKEVRKEAKRIEARRAASCSIT
jgi:hypothetical protein